MPPTALFALTALAGTIGIASSAFIMMEFHAAHKTSCQMKTLRKNVLVAFCLYFSVADTDAAFISSKLPNDLDTWRVPGSVGEEEKIWIPLNAVFRKAGLTLWPVKYIIFSLQDSQSEFPRVSGFAYVTSSRGERGEIGTARALTAYNMHVRVLPCR
jgi:hypothetical protein